LAPPVDARLPEGKRKAFALLMESLLALRRENKEVLWSSMVKDTMKRKKPSFNESYHGYRSFSDLLEDAKKEGLLDLDTDKRSRTYVVTRFGAELNAAEEGETEASPAKKRSRRRRSGAKRRGPTEAASPAVADEQTLPDAGQPAAIPPAAPEPASPDEGLFVFPERSEAAPDS
jgi:hypothetical protein